MLLGDLWRILLLGGRLAGMAETATQNRWVIGGLYQLGLLNGQPFYTQPGGIGTQVFPTQANAVPWPEYPVPGLILNEYVPWWAPGCGHSIKYWKIFKEWDYDTNQSCALVCCPACTYVQSVIEPFEEWLNPIQRAIIVS